MAQPKVTDFFNVRKKNADIHPSKRRKVEAITDGVLVSDSKAVDGGARTRARSKVVKVPRPGVSSQSSSQSQDKVLPQTKPRDHTPEILPLTSAACDDHHASPPSTPSKRTSTEEKTSVKRSRTAKPKDLLKDVEQQKTPESFNFARFTDSEKSKRVRKRLAVERFLPKPDNRVPMPESLSPKQVECPSKLTSGPKERKDQSQKQTKPQATKPPKSSVKKKEENNSKLKVIPNNNQKLDPTKPATQAVAKTNTTSDSKASSSKQPEFQRFKHLYATPLPPTLCLPGKYQILGEMFRSADTVVSMLYKRSETCTFSKLRAAVQKMISKNFEEMHLGQIKTVMPLSYSLRQEKNLPKFAYQNTDKGDYQLTVEPILDEEAKYDKDGRPAFSSDQMTRRKNIFHRALIAIVKKFHQEFLSSLDRPLTVDDEKLTRWHPDFKLNEVPDIKAAELPMPPQVKKLTTAREVLEEGRGKLNPRVQSALELISGKEPETKDQNPQSKPQTTKAPKSPEKKKVESNSNNNSKLQGVSSSLLERIRAKERQQQQAALTRSPAQQLREDRIQRLPQLCRILRNVFVMQKKPALTQDEVILRLSDSYRTPLGLVEAEKHLDLMLELAPDWIQILKIKRGSFIKIDKSKDLNGVIEKIEKVAKNKSG